MQSFLRRVVGFAAVVALCAGTLSACASGNANVKVESLREALARLAPATPLRSLKDAPEPTSYRIVYDRYIAGRTDGKVLRTHGIERKRLTAASDERNVVRPFDETGAVTRRMGFERVSRGGVSRVTLVRPLPDDPRPRVYPPDDHPTKQRTVAGRRCVVHARGNGEDCVDAAGLVLVTRDAESLEVARTVTIGHETRSADQLRAALAQGFINQDRGSIRPIDPDSAPGGATDYSLDNPPDGYTLVGRYAVVGLSKALLDRSSKKIIAGIVDVYVDGINTIVVERGGKLDTSTADDSDLGSLSDAHDVDLGATLGQGTAGVAGDGPYGYREVRAAPSQGRYVVVAGTVPEDQLVAIAQSLHAWPGVQIVYLDHPIEGPKVPPTTVPPDLPPPPPGP